MAVPLSHSMVNSTVCSPDLGGVNSTCKCSAPADCNAKLIGLKPKQPSLSWMSSSTCKQSAQQASHNA